MNRSRHWRRYLLGSLALGLAALSCSSGSGSESKVDSLRILAVTADYPYAHPGQEVTLRMTVADGFVDPNNPTAGPRNLQILWLGGCFDPAGDAYYMCFTQFADLFASLGSGTPPPGGLVQFNVLPGSSSGVPDAVEYHITMPDDLVSRRPAPATGPQFGTAFVFFAACAGTIAPVDLSTYQGYVEGQGIDFPLRCLDAAGNPLGPDSFVPGYTQIYVFADGRENANPPIDDMTLNDVPMSENPDDYPVVPICALTDAERKATGCARASLTDCEGYKLDAIIPDVAEIDIGATDIDGNQLREIVWVDYFADGGDLAGDIMQVSDARTGYQADHSLLWYAPADPGIVSLWAVVRDHRGGSSLMRRFVRVQ